MSDPNKTQEVEIELVPLRLGSTKVPPTKAELDKMLKTCRQVHDREIEWVWVDQPKGRHHRLIVGFPDNKAHAQWDQEIKDDPTWILSDNRDLRNPVIWQYKTSDLDLVFEMTRMAEKSPQSAARPTASNTNLEALSADSINNIVVTDDFASEMVSPETGLLTYSAFLIFLQREYHWFEAYGTPLSLLVFDIKIHTPGADTTQWLASDLARLLNRRVIRRQCDTFGQFESVDFGLILPNTEPKQAMAVAQRVAQILTRLPLKKDEPNTKLMVNCGVASLPANGTDLASLFHAAKGAKIQAVKSDESLQMADVNRNYAEESREYRKKTTSEAAVKVMGLRELLVRSGTVNEGYLDTALGLAKRMPLGRVLAMEGHCKESTVDAASELANMIQKMEVTPDEGLRTLQLVANYDLDLDTALKRIGVIRGGIKPNWLGDLFRDAGLLSPKQLGAGRREAVFTGLPLGMTLVFQGNLTPELLESSLLFQRLIREGKISRENVVTALAAMRAGSASLQQIFEGARVQLVTDNFGEGFVQQGMLTRLELLMAYEIELNTGCTFDAALVQSGYATEDQVRVARGSLA